MEILVANCGERPARVVSSDLRRARDSAEILTRRWGLALRTDARLREMHFGEWEGRTWEELEQADTDRLGQWMRDWTTTRAPGGESFADVVTRTSAWLDEWSGSDRAAEGATVVVAHAGTVRAILCRLLRVPLEEAFGFEVGHARVTVVDLAGGAPRLAVANADSWSEGVLPPDPTRCPLCGEENACGIAAGESVADCWCYGESLGREALARVAPSSRNRVCICARCAELNWESAEPR
jgi:broad specificity phosphatase PhoE